MSDWAVLHGDAMWWLRELPAGSIDAVVTDPPYGIGFMGHAWDQPGEHGALRGDGRPRPFGGSEDKRNQFRLQRAMARQQRRGRHHAGTGLDTRPSDNGAFEAGRYDFSPDANQRFQAWCEAWAAEVLRVLKPGGYLVAFGGTRTYHRLVCGLEDAGFEIRDQLTWLFGSGFPKSRKLADGVGTALKPGHEPICLARAPVLESAAATYAAYGTAGLNIDAGRIPVVDGEEYARNHSGDRGHNGTRPMEERGATDLRPGGGSASDVGRWPANVALDETAAELLDEQSGILVSGANPTRRSSDKFADVYGDFPGQDAVVPARGVDRGGASRFFYCAKTSTAERNAGLGGGFAEKALLWSAGEQSPGSFQAGGPGTHRNSHPTVKPIELMRWLVRLVTPPGGVVLDLFTGSGTTGCAAALEGIDFVGIEREPSKPGAPDYVAIAEARIGWWAPHRGKSVAEVLNDRPARPPAAVTGQLGLLGDLT